MTFFNSWINRRLTYLRTNVVLVCLATLLLWGGDLNVMSNAQDAGWGAVDVGESLDEVSATWGRREDEHTSSEDLTAANSSNDLQAFTGPATTRYSLELSKLPDDAGQFWVVYDITPYTDRFPNLASPQDSIVDWILFDSGEGFWRKDPFSILSASRNRLYVYHNDSIQRYVSNVVDRFLDPNKQNIRFSVKIVVLQSPEWRARESQYLSPINATIVGNGADVQCWLAERSDLTKITADLEKRSDYILLNAGKNAAPNGETFGWAAAKPRKEFNRDYRVDTKSTAGYTADVSSVDEGFRIETTPLLSTTGETVEVTFRYRSTIVEKTRSFSIRVPTSTSPRQQLSVEKPSIVSCDFRGKISVPRSKSAIVDLGLVPLALPPRSSEQGGLIGSVSSLISQKSVFYNVLLIIEEDGN
jgi:hypothetical protein